MSTPVTPSAPSQSGFAALLDKLNVALGGTADDPSHAALTGFAMGLGKAGAPHMLTPVPFGTALSMGEQGAQQYQAGRLSNLMQQAVLPATQAKTQAIVGALNTPNSYPARTFIDNILGGQAGVSNDPSIAGPATLAKTLNSFQKLPANQRAYIFSLLKKFMPQGSMPEGTTQNPDGSVSTMLGAPAAITANAFNKAGGAAAATLPYQAALSYHTRAPGAAGGTLGPRPPGFAPMPGPGGVPPQAPAATPSAQSIAALQAAMRSRQMGTVQGVSQAAQTAGAPAPLSLPPSRGSGTNPNPPAPGTLAASQEVWKTPQGRAQVAAGLNAALAAQRTRATPPVPTAPQPMAAQGGRPILTLRPPAAAVGGSGLVAPGLSPAQVELQKQAAQQTGAQEAEGGKETEAANQQLARLSEMQSALTQIPVGGNLAKVYQGIGDVLNYAGVKLPGMDAIQEFSKYRTNFVADAARKMGAKVSYQEVGYIAKGVPDFTLQGNAPKALLAQLQGAAQYDIARNQAMQYYATHVPNLYGKPYQGTTRGFEQWWQKSGVTPGALMFMNTLFALPPADRAQYLANFRGTLTGKVYLQQYAKGQAFLRSNPQLAPFWSAQQ